jgi:RimJ/RimL family protein N-acetyltransferase
MTNFVPGQLIKEITQNDGSKVTISNVDWKDIDDLTNFINSLSQEDAHDLFSGEIITKYEQANYISGVFIDAEFGNCVLLIIRNNGEFVGFGGVYREKRKRTRSQHVGIFHIGIAQKYRRQGYGFMIGTEIISSAKRYIYGLRNIELDCFGNNDHGIRLYSKLGFQEVGRIPERYYHKGNYVDMVLMSQKVIN